ncbi:GAF domain-containing protein, partial [Patescibacteria group bacterium]|nr:GAF domain-containing protein [Patescibacteria group bacterium]
KNMRWVFNQFYYDSPPGLFYIPFTCFFIGLVIYSHYKLWKVYKYSKGTQKYQIKYFFLATAIGFVGGGFSFLPVYKIDLYPVLNFTVFLYPLIIAYAILRYRFLDIRVAVRRGFLKLILAAFAYGTFYGALWFFERSFGSAWAVSALITGIFIALAFAILWPYIERLTLKFSNRFLYASIYTIQDTLSNLAQDLTSIIDLDKITTLISRVIFKVMDVERVGILVKLPNKPEFQALQMIGFTRQSGGQASKKKISLINNDIISGYVLKHQSALVKGELFLQCQDCREASEQTQMREICEIMDKTKIELILPLIIKDQLIGLIVLGEKQTGDAYTTEDIKLLETLSNQAAIAIENARLYNNMEEMVAEQTQDIRRKNVKLQKLLKMRSEFLDIASHQLRTPISIIKGSASVLSEGDFDDSSDKEKKEVYKAILVKTEKLTQIVADMLYASELDTGKFNLSDKELQTTEIIPYLENIIKSHQEMAQEKNIKLELNKTNKHIKARVSDRYLEIVLDNLIINALTYTKQDGKVEITVKPQDDIIRIEVKDNGIGVPKQDQKELFTKFKRAKNANSMHTDGSGLGLFIIKKMIKAHPKGKCGFKSELGVGSCFWVEVERAVT